MITNVELMITHCKVYWYCHWVPATAPPPNSVAPSHAEGTVATMMCYKYRRYSTLPFETPKTDET